jgi:hypothetical protein
LFSRAILHETKERDKLMKSFLIASAVLALATSAVAETTYYRDGVNMTGTLVAFEHGCTAFRFFDLDADAANMLDSAGACATGFVAGSGQDREVREALAEAEAAAALEAASS